DIDQAGPGANMGPDPGADALLHLAAAPGGVGRAPIDHDAVVADADAAHRAPAVRDRARVARLRDPRAQGGERQGGEREQEPARLAGPIRGPECRHGGSPSPGGSDGGGSTTAAPPRRPPTPTT